MADTPKKRDTSDDAALIVDGDPGTENTAPGSDRQVPVGNPENPSGTGKNAIPKPYVSPFRFKEVSARDGDPFAEAKIEPSAPVPQRPKEAPERPKEAPGSVPVEQGGQPIPAGSQRESLETSRAVMKRKEEFVRMLLGNKPTAVPAEPKRDAEKRSAFDELTDENVPSNEPYRAAPIPLFTQPKQMEIHPQAAPADSVEIERSGTERTSPKTAIPAREVPAGKTLVLSYDDAAPLIPHVEIYALPYPRGYYRRFREDALRLYRAEAVEAPYISFFSYVPQYTQLTLPQLRFYLWWRENLRKGNPLPTDFSYLLLFLFEIINLPDVVRPEEGLDLLTRAYLAYGTRIERSGECLSEWIVDYCLIHRLPPPVDKLTPVLSLCMKQSRLASFYYRVDDDPIKAARRLAISTSVYDYRATQYYKEDRDFAVDLERHVAGAIAYIEAQCPGAALSPTADGHPVTYERDTFQGTITATEVKYTIRVTYYPISRAGEARSLVTSIVKHTENRVRASHKIRARLRVQPLPDDVSSALSAYLDRSVGKPISKEAEAEREYLKQYDAPVSTLSPSDARAIETASWRNTDRLVVEEEPAIEEPQPQPILQPIPQPISTYETAAEDGGYTVFFDRVEEKYPGALPALSDGTFRAFCRMRGLFDGAIAEEINALALDLTGDTFIETSDAGAAILEDYKEEYEIWLKK